MTSRAAAPPASAAVATPPAWEPTREAGLRHLADFAPRAGRLYAQRRNLDLSPPDRSNVSTLSPWIRRRLITEEEVIRSVLSHHSATDADKFVQEICWRTYWKGWLELRPSTLDEFDADCAALHGQWRTSAPYLSACRGETGIACFDAWAGELATTGWLHNHARMWFASIWIFTLGLPWQLGADHFYRQLVDADPASNTLSWRWVAGLHTRGKHYLARAENIRVNTLGRFDPRGQLNEQAGPLPAGPPPPPPLTLPPDEAPVGRRVGLLVTEEDLHPESLTIPADVTTIAAAPTLSLASPHSPAHAFSRGAIDDAIARSASHFGVSAAQVDWDAIAGWAKASGLDEIVTAHAPAGPVARRLSEIEQALRREGIRLVRIRRDWDSRAWPHAAHGFFRFKAAIPSLVASLL